jgi:uncharacterized protein (DUF433 family)
MARPLTTAEVAALTGTDEGRIRKDIEHGFFGRTTPPRFGFPAVVYFRTVRLLGLDLKTKDRRALFKTIKRALSSERPDARVPLGEAAELKLGEISKDLSLKLEKFEAWKTRLVIDADILAGEPTFPKSRLAVRHVGAMVLRGATLSEIREDYPYLSEDDVELALLYTQSYPRLGRPREAPPG